MKPFVERMAIIPGGSERSSESEVSGAVGSFSLDALYRKGRRASAVLLVPGVAQLGQGRDSTVLSELAWHFAQAGWGTLRFSWRGTGSSSGKRLLDPLAPVEDLAHHLEGFVADIRLAFDELRHTEPDSDITLVAVSAGCAPAWAFAADNPAVARTVWVAPPCSRGLMGARRGAAPRPTVFVGADDKEATPADVEAWFGPDTPVVVIERAGHDFARGLTDLCTNVVQRLALSTGHDRGLS